MVVMLSAQCLCSKIIWAYHRGAFNQDNMSSAVIPSTEEGQSGSDRRCRRQKRALSKDGDWRETQSRAAASRTCYCEMQTAEEADYERKGYVVRAVPENTQIQRFECLIKTHVITLTFEQKGAMR